MIKRLLLLLLLALLAFVGWRYLAARPAADTGLQFPHHQTEGFRRPLVIAHADDSGAGLYPGNTPVFLQQMAAMKVDVLEMDVHATADNELVLMHDATVDRTTDGEGAIVDKTLADLKTLNVAYNWSRDGKSYPYRDSPQRILTVDEVFRQYPKYPMVIELKSPGEDAAQSLCRKLKAFNKSNQVIVSSFHQQAIDAFRRDCGHVATGAGGDDVKVFALATRVGAFRLLSPNYQALHIPVEYDGINLVSANAVAQAQNHGVRVDVWTINDELQMRRLIEMGVDGIMTDRPDRLIKVIEEIQEFQEMSE
ncbi:glycerophosphodiester phosphodiesterase [Microbulbifer hydrolyticus]|uniref:Glycerophosphodiester phosphodiesterase n=1 Tax=Microbulbifer hydrolyticus TaxID=48074 RepID=A0A6P1TGW5_9GAMM|nr:glycerophosphodiester phosphodiesterase [Microbulbifer hydrolyticus]MBB5212429.1 glycerophosphoryl diester phosphodiesterase [Microbulbifer hydrolyticus]QHQ40062.1 glycerophosphodiester phosphodiesterase [Microbulbifer hydrolyticus]